jgi:hypothetical protein
LGENVLGPASPFLIKMEDENVKTWMGMILDVLDKFSWQIVVLIIFFFLRKPIEALIHRIRKITGGGIEVDVANDQVEPAPPITRDLRGILSMKGEVQAKVLEAAPAYGKGLGDKLSFAAKTVLSTLWKHQQTYYGDDLSKGRWSFMVGPGSPLFLQYMRGLSELMERGFVLVLPANGQAVLTDSGIHFCQENPGEILSDWSFKSWK